MNVISQIQMNMPSYSSGQREIAQYIVSDPSHVIDLSIHEMAADIGVSASSITRFCRKLGFDSLRDMRIEIAKAADEKAADDFRRAISWTDTPEELASNYLGYVSEVCRETLRINDMATFKEVARLICEAENVYVYGIGASALAARNLLGKLIKLHIRCNYDFDANQATQMAMSSTERDVAIAFSYSGASRDVLQAVRNSRKCGCPVVAVTRQGSSRFVQLATHLIQLPPVEQVTRVTTLFTNYCQALVVDVLFLLCAQRLEVNPDNLLREYREIVPDGRLELLASDDD